MLAYFAPGVRVLGPAREIIELARLMVAGPWKVKTAQHPKLGTGALAWNGEGDLPDNLLTTGEWRDCGDGLHYRKPSPLPSQADIARAGCPRGIDVLMSTGVLLTIPLALAAPRKLSFARPGLGDPATEFGIIAERLFERFRTLPDDKIISFLDPDCLAVVTQALMAAYKTTPELLDDLGWVTSTDVESILLAVMGSDPKASAPDPSTSPSPAVGSQESR